MGGLRLSASTVLSVLSVCTMLATSSASAATPVTPDKLDSADSSWDLCRNAAHEVNRSLDMPGSLLAAISVTETGITNRARREITPWPWTINVRGKGYRYASKDDAVTAVRTFLDKGVRSIDVGCMQVNLKYHPRAFTSLEEAFDPVANVTYASEFLDHLKKRRATWPRAVQAYHSYEPDDGAAYRSKVDKYWAKEKKRAAAEQVRKQAELKSRLRRIAAAQSSAVLSSLGKPVGSETQAPRGALASLAPEVTERPETSRLSAETLKLLPVRTGRGDGNPAVFLDLALDNVPEDDSSDRIRISQADTGQGDPVSLLN